MLTTAGIGYLVVSRERGTVVTKHVTSNGNPLIFYIECPAVRADAMTSLRNLKRVAESGD